MIEYLKTWIAYKAWQRVYFESTGHRSTMSFKEFKEETDGRL